MSTGKATPTPYIDQRSAADMSVFLHVNAAVLVQPQNGFISDILRPGNVSVLASTMANGSYCRYGTPSQSMLLSLPYQVSVIAAVLLHLVYVIAAVLLNLLYVIAAVINGPVYVIADVLLNPLYVLAAVLHSPVYICYCSYRAAAVHYPGLR